MANPRTFDIKIDKLTRSIENAISGDSFKTEILELTSDDLKRVKKSAWLFNWKSEAKQVDKTIYKLVIEENSRIIQGLISIQDRGDHILWLLSRVVNSTVVLTNFI
ncbi:hypothetical protein [Spirosoma arboris]|uniref:hypothetical protein n=1 Tax=Spirosoma arboris TaxID=2682092 RepID=UPI001D120BFE|nr:hypothetical protein [Spirosoma arboris]